MYVKRVLANQGRLTVTRDGAVSAQALDAERVAKILAKQRARGALAAGAERIATVVAVEADTGLVRVAAGRSLTAAWQQPSSSLVAGWQQPACLGRAAPTHPVVSFADADLPL